MVSSSCIIQRQLFLSILYSKISCFSLKCSLESFISSISSLECKGVSLGLFLLFGVGIDKFFSSQIFLQNFLNIFDNPFTALIIACCICANFIVCGIGFGSDAILSAICHATRQVKQAL